MFRKIDIRIFAISAIILLFWLKDIAAQTVQDNALQIKVENVNAQESESFGPLPNPIAIHPNDTMSTQLITDNKPDDVTIRDLAAQEAMAFWAELSFYITGLGIILSAGGLGVLFYSLKLNRRALKLNRRATKAAQSAVEVARDANQAQSRAWVSVTCNLGKPKTRKTHAGVDGIEFEVTCAAKNHGRSPATGVAVQIKMSLLGYHSGTIEDVLKEFCDRFRKSSDNNAQAIFPEVSITLSRNMLFLSLAEIEENISNESLRTITPIVYGCVSYQSPATEGVRQTRFLYYVCAVDKDKNVLGLFPDKADWLEKPPIHLIGPVIIASD